MVRKRPAVPPERARLRRWRVLGWGLFMGGVLLAWGVLWVMGQDRGAFAGVRGLELLAGLCAADAAALAPGALVAMWAVMAAAMMAPTAVPAIAAWVALPRGGSGGPVGVVLLVAGYLAVWLAVSLLFALVQGWLTARGLAAVTGESLSPWLTAGLFVLAGGYQFSRLKAACLSRCRAPVAFFLAHWRPGPWGALRVGLRLGGVCLGCCWALMGLAFVGGMANLLWMGLATAIMVLEKLPRLGRPLTRPLGWTLLALGLVAAIAAMGDPA